MSSSVTAQGLVDHTQPWPGLTSYHEADSELFFGREQESLELLRLVRRQVLTVLFGPSGAGKTSLLNAGLFPRLRESGLLPVAIRLDHASARPNYIGQIRVRFAEALHADALHPIEEEALTPQQALADQETLWEYLHRVVFWDWRNNPITPVLVFDQFEEIFTLGRNRAAKEDFLTALADVVENYIPAAVRSRMETPGEAIPFPHDQPKCKVLLSLREDFVWRLDGLRKLMPSVMHNRFTVTRMSGEQALLAVREPGRNIINEAVAHDIVLFVAAAKESPTNADASDLCLKNLQVEPAFLSVVCRELNTRRLRKGEEWITSDSLEEANTDILTGFYGRAFEGLSAAARVFVEDRLLTASGFRSTVPLEEATQTGLAEETIRTLEDRRLIRTEQRLNIPHLELTHDLLTKVVQNSRQERHARKQREEEARARAEQEKQQADELRRTRRLLLVVSSAAMVCVVLGLLALFAWRQSLAKQRESKARELAASAVESLAEDPERSVLLGIFAVDATFRFGEGVVPAAEDALHRAVLSSNVRLTLRRHSDRVSSVSFSLDRKRLATASWDGTSKLWDATTGVELLTLGGHSGHVNIVVFSPDGKRLATGGDDHTAKLWDATTGQELFTLQGHTDVVFSVAFSPDGHRLATASWDKTAKLWDVATGKEMLTLRGHWKAVSGVVFSPDGKRLATAGDDGTAKIWDSFTGRELLALQGHGAAVSGVAFSPDGKRLATASRDNTARLWDAATGQPLLTLWGHRAWLTSVAFRDNKTLVTASYDHTAKLWDATTGQELLTLQGHADSVLGISPCVNSMLLATASSDHTARVWDTDIGQEVHALRGHSDAINRVAFSPNGRILATASRDHTAKLWDATTGQELLTMRRHTKAVFSVAFSPDGKSLASTSDDETAKLWDANGQELLTLRGPTTITGATFSPDGKRLATAGDDGTAKIWGSFTGRELLALQGHGAAVSGVAFSPDGKRLATASRDNTARLWDAATGQELFSPLRGHSSYVLSVTFSPDGQRLATASYDGTAKLWDTANGKELMTLQGHTGPVIDVAFSPDGQHLATASWDKTAKLWDVATGHELFTLRGHYEVVNSVAFSPDGKLLATASQDATVQIYTLDIQNLLALARRRVTRLLTTEECRRYFQSGVCPAVT